MRNCVPLFLSRATVFSFSFFLLKKKYIEE
jgi:hypothetical protein